MDMNLNPHNPSSPSPCLRWNILKMSLVYFPCLSYRIDIVDWLTEILVNWLTEKIMVSFSCRILKCNISGTSVKLLYFEAEIVRFVGIWKNWYFLKLELLQLWEYLKSSYFFTESAWFAGKSTNLLLLV